MHLYPIYAWIWLRSRPLYDCIHLDHRWLFPSFNYMHSVSPLYGIKAKAETHKAKELYCENPMILLRTPLETRRNYKRSVYRQSSPGEEEKEWRESSVFFFFFLLWGCSPVFISPETYDTTALCFESRRLVCLHSGVGREREVKAEARAQSFSAADSVEETDWQAEAMLWRYRPPYDKATLVSRFYFVIFDNVL